LRAGPKGDVGLAKPQAFGAAALWTNGGSRGGVAFDHRAWADGVWRTTAVAASADIDLHYTCPLAYANTIMACRLSAIGDPSGARISVD